MLDVQKHKFILVQILKEIYSNIKIASILGFKDGTAMHLFYNLPRFSVDLDFNLLDYTKKNIIKKKILEILNKFGNIKEHWEKHFTLFFLISYEEKLQNIKVEISKREFPDNYEIKNYLGISMKVMIKQDIFAHKLAALLDRKTIANRDLFDIWFFTKEKWPINKELLERRTGLVYKEYLKKCILKIESINERYILQGLGELIDQEMELWVKGNLKNELLFYLKYYRENI